MPSLHESQTQFYEAMFDKNQTITGVDSSRLHIYRNTMFHVLHQALRSSYPVIIKLVGDDFFNFLAQQYTTRYPSVSGDLNRYGDSFFELLPLLPQTATLPYLANVAQLEWCVQLAENAHDSAPFSMQRLTNIAPQHYANLQFVLHSSVYLVSSIYPIAQIWHANQAQGDGVVELHTDTFYCVVNRVDYQVAVTTLNTNEWAFLKAIQQGIHFGALCETLIDVDVGALLQHFIAQSVIVDFIHELST